MTTLLVIALILVIVGAINWGLIGLFNFNLVSAIFGDRSTAAKVIYVLVGLAGLFSIYLLTQVNTISAATRQGY